jgi:cytochrome c peroxidase
LAQLISASMGAARARKTAQATAAAAANLVPQGGLFWDGRVNTLQAQALGPMLNPLEMDGGSVARLAAKLRAAPYAPRLAVLFGPDAFEDSTALANAAAFALSCYEQEERRFYPYSSKFDAWLQGKARFTAAEARGYKLFNDPDKGNCAACHVDQPAPDGRPPLFTDHQYEALGVPRNPDLTANRNSGYYDMGICGPYRTDMSNQAQLCGLFLTPTLRNVATRHVFMHNGEYHTLSQVLDFYNFRDTEPQKIYPAGPDGKPQKYNDLPVKYQANIDSIDPPLNRSLGGKPALTPDEEQDIIAFLNTLTDGYSAP